MAKKVRSLPRIPNAVQEAGGGQQASAAGKAADACATIAIYSVKGGVGKTTLAANLAWCSAVGAGRRTLLWDLDAAGGSGFLFGVEPRKSGAAEDVFSLDRDPDKLIRKTAFAGLDVLPADESLRSLDATLVGIGKRKRLAKLAEKLSAGYDRIVLDCPPVINEISAQVMRAADLVIVPLPPSPLSARAFDLVVREISENRKADNRKGRPPMLPVLSMLDLRRSLHRAARDEHPDWPVIPYASVIEQCAVHQQPLGAFAPQTPAARQFRRLWRAIETRLSARTGE